MGPLPLQPPDQVLPRPRLRRRLLGPPVQAQGVACHRGRGLRRRPGVRGVQLQSEAGRARDQEAGIKLGTGCVGGECRRLRTKKYTTYIHTCGRIHTARSRFQSTPRTITIGDEKYGREICTTMLNWTRRVRERKTGARRMATVRRARGTRPNWCEHGSERAGIDRRFVIGMNRIIDSQQCSRGQFGDDGAHLVISFIT